MSHLCTMTVGELIEELSQHDEDMPVVFSYDYGDHWRTRVTADIRGVETASIEYSDYHSMHKEADEDDEAAIPAVIINYSEGSMR